MKKISIVVPMYKEEEMIPIFFEHIEKIIKDNPSYEFEIVSVNDGSTDRTLELLVEKQKECKNLVVVDLSRNWGHESAVFAGLNVASGDAIIPIDADLQDPPEIIPQMIEMWEQGYQVVNAKRSSRAKDTKFKKNTAGIYYKILNKMSGKIKIPDNVANFRLIDRVVLDKLLEMKENNRVFRVEVPFLGYKTGTVLFSREERVKGESKYNFSAMFNLALESVLSVTTKPLRWPITFAILFACLFFASGVAELTLYILTLNHVLDMSMFGFGVWLIANVILFISIFVFGILAIMSIYLADVVDQSRNRPNVVINKVYKNK